MKGKNKLKGTGVAIITPFKKDGSVDYKALEKLAEHLIKGRVEYLVALGTTGESATLSKEEKSLITQCIAGTAVKRIPVVLGIGGNNTKEIINTIEKTDFSGIEAILSVSPYYNKPNQEGIFRHYKAIAEESPLPVILYNVPGRTGSNITAETTLRLANECENITGVKEASGNMAQIMAIIKDRPKGFLVISGDDLLTLPIIACGGDGVISVVANAFPADYSEMVRLSLANKYEEAKKLHYKLTTITDLLFADGSPGGIKAALEIMGICDAYLRLPLAPVNKKIYAAITEEVKKLY
jgi:4-hydroxy-tetrahydrodipicolinate synthase